MRDANPSVTAINEGPDSSNESLRTAFDLVVLPAADKERLFNDGRDYTLSEWLRQESLQEVIESYLRYYAAGTSHTARAKRYDLQYFLDFLGQNRSRQDVLVSDWTVQATKDFLDYRLGIGESPATVCRRLATIKHFGRTLAERVREYINPAREVKSPSVQPTRPHNLSAEEVELLLRAAAQAVEQKETQFMVLRNQFLLQLLLATGLRADEVRLLLLGQIGQDHCWLRNVKTKGRKFRNVYLETGIRAALQDYLERRDEELLKRFPGYQELPAAEKQKLPLFVSFYRASLLRPASLGLSPKSIWRIIAEHGKTAQALADRPLPSLHPHMLRHTFAHGLLDSSKDVRLVAQALGHSDVRTTMRYTERTEDEVAKAIERKAARA